MSELPDLRVVTTGLQFPEGPIAMADGSVLVVEIARGSLSRVAPDGRVQVVAQTGGGPNGAAIGPDGKCYICNNGGFEWIERRGRTYPGDQANNYRTGRIERVDLDTGAVEMLYEAAGDVPLRGPNDIVFDADGGFWFTDHGKTRARQRDRTGVFYAKADGSHIEEVIFPMEAPNGVGLSGCRRRTLRGRDTDRQAVGVSIVRPRAIGGRTSRSTRRRPLGAGPGRLLPVRFNGRRRGGQRLRGNADRGWHHGAFADRRRSRLRADAGSDHDEHLFRRR